MVDYQNIWEKIEHRFLSVNKTISDLADRLTALEKLSQSQSDSTKLNKSELDAEKNYTNQQKRTFAMPPRQTYFISENNPVTIINGRESNSFSLSSQEIRQKTRSKRTKENSKKEVPSIAVLKESPVTTPQQANVTPTAGKAKKLRNRATKVMAFLTSKLKCGSSISLQRENSEEDLNKLQQLAEERKRQREEKNCQKSLEMEVKRRELEETASKTNVHAAEAARQERDLLYLPPAQRKKYDFSMLHSDDSTDEEGKISYKRPTSPQWSKTSVRVEFITSQAYLSSDIIDSFYSVQSMTPDLKVIFPNIDPSYLARNSSAIWSTLPRHSEMPKF